MAKQIPILFSTPMVQAILDRKKTMTRRILKIAKQIENPEFGYTTFTPDRSISVRGLHGGIFAESFLKCPYGKKGDILWVRETFQTWNLGYLYKATYGEKTNADWKWKPSIFMPKEAARIWLRVTDVKIERVKDVSDGDVAREGVTWNEPLQIGRDERNCNSPAQRAFRRLWDKINGEDSWDKNPFVWVVSFKVLSTTGKPKKL